MKETEVIFPDPDIPQAEDKDGNIYTHADMNDESIFKAIDEELSYFGLELLVGNSGSTDYFFCIKKREEK